METIYFKGVECHTMGAFPRVGNKAYCFSLTTSLFKEVELGDYKGECVVLNIFPSLDTDVCAMSVRKFNEMASLLDDVVVICVSMDLPFAAQRFCVAEGIDDVIVASAFRSATFGQKYGVQIVDGLLSGLLARAVVVINEDRRIVYSQLVEEIANEPDYERCYEAIKMATIMDCKGRD